MQALGLVHLIVGIIALSSDHTRATMISYIPGTSKVDKIMALNELVKNGAIYFIILGVVVIGIGSLGCFGACAKIKWMLYLVSNRHAATAAAAAVARVFLLFH